MSNFDLVSMPKIDDLRFAAAATKSRVSSSSLSNDSIAESHCALASFKRALSRWRLVKSARCSNEVPTLLPIAEYDKALC